MGVVSRLSPRNAIVALLFLIAAGVLARPYFQCEGVCIEQAVGKYKTVDSGINVAEYSRLYWLDDERVLFTALSDEVLKTHQVVTGKGQFYTYVPRIVIWNSRTNERKDLGDGGVGCYYNGMVSYSRFVLVDGKRHEDRRTYYTGPLGSEKEITDAKRRVEGDVFHEETCQWESDLATKLPDWDIRKDWNGYQTKRLLPTGNFLAWPRHPHDWGQPLRFCLPGAAHLSECKELPIPASALGIGNGRFKYSAFNQRHYIHSSETHSTEPGSDFRNKPWRTWTLGPEGAAAAIDIPYFYGRWGGPYRLTNQGVLFFQHYNGRNEERVAKFAGLMLIKDGRVTRIHDQLIDLSGHLEVSPDGCKVAVRSRNRPYPRASVPATLKVISLC